MIEVEEGGLSPFEQDALAVVEGVMDEVDRVGDHRCESGRELIQVARRDVVRADGGPVIDLGEDEILLVQDDVELLAKDLRIEEVLHAQPHARGLVSVRRADAAFRRAKGVSSEEAFGEAVELLVVGHDEVRVARHHESRDVNASIDERVEFGQQHRRIDDDAVANDRGHARIENARRDELECELLALDDDAVTRVVSALVANDEIHVARQKIG